MTSAELLNVTRTHIGSGWRIRLSGVIDERFDPSKLIEGLRGVVVLDLDGVKRITSFGVREWVRAMRTLEVDYLGFIHVRPSMISQFNMISGFGGAGEVISLYAPYLCDHCGEITELLLDMRKQHEVALSGDMPEVRCHKCGSETEFDDLPESYFAHIAASPAPSPPPAARALIDGGTDTSVPFKIEKEVEGDVTALWISGTLDKGRRLKRIGDGLQGEVVVVMGGITSVAPDGLAGLKAFASTQGPDIYFARVPAETARFLRGSCGRARVISILLSLRCPHCRTSEVREASAKALSLLLTGHDSEETCITCGKRLFADVEETALEELLQLPIAPGSLAVRNYLKDHAEGPTVSRVASQSRDASRDGSIASAPTLIRGPLRPPRDPTRRWFGEYEILQSLGVGGMGEVLLAKKSGPQGFEKKVVLKRILPQYASDAPRLDMFLSEARLAARLGHPNIVQIYDLGEISGEYFIAMEYVNGWDLAKITRRALDSKLQWPPELACWVIGEVCAALRAAQEHRDESGTLMPIVHRDVSPENVLISRDGAVKLADFGVAKVVDPQSMTQPGSIKGKLGYMAPERLIGPPRPVDGRIDVFAAGVILHECLSGKRLFVRDNEGSTLLALVEQNIPKIRDTRTDVPAEVDAILSRALARDPANRYPNAAAFRFDLEQQLVRFGKPVSAENLAAWLSKLFEGSSEARDGLTSGSLDDIALTTPMVAPPAMTQAGWPREDD